MITRLAARDDNPEFLAGTDGEDVKVTNVKVSADRATADVRPTFDGVGPTARYVREDGRWKVDSDSGADGG